jgi:hypothetical protein
MNDSFRDRSSAIRGSVERFYAVGEKYGYGEVPAREVYATFDDLASLTSDGFSTIKPAFYARSMSADIVHLVKLQALKGWTYTVWWGVGLTYLPRVSGSALRWSRTLKSARFDLWEEPLEYFGLLEMERDVSDKYSAQNGHGPQYLRETMTQMWSTVAAPVREWLSATQDLPSVLARSEEQQNRHWRGPRHGPDPGLVRAFTLNRLGHGSQARAAFDEYAGSPDVSRDECELLRTALSR